jgi:hypothetical protein
VDQNIDLADFESFDNQTSQSLEPMVSPRYMGQQSQAPSSQSMDPMYSQRFSGNQQAQTKSSSHSMDSMYSNRFGNPPYQQGAPYSDQQQPTGIQQPGYTGGFSGKPMMGQDYQNFQNQGVHWIHALGRWCLRLLTHISR